MALVERVRHEQNIGEFINLFQRYNQTKGLSEYTITFYDNTLRHFKSYLEESNINEITKYVYQNYVLYLQTELNNSITINSYLRGVRALLYFLMAEEEIAPFKINLIKQEKKAKPIYSEDDIKKLIKKLTPKVRKENRMINIIRSTILVYKQSNQPLQRGWFLYGI